MKKLFTGFLLTVCSFSSWAQHFGFSYEVSSYVPAGANEVQLNGSSAVLGKNKVSGNLMVLSGDHLTIVNETNGKVISRFGGDGHFQNAQSITTDSQGNYYIGDFGSKMVVKYDVNGNYLLSWGSLGSGNGQFKGFEGICTDDVDNIYVADATNNRIQKFDAQGNFIMTWGTSGTGAGQFKSPYAITYWPSLGSLVVADFLNTRIQTFSKTGAFISQTALSASPFSLDVDLVNNRLLVLGQGKIFQFDNNLVAPSATWGPNGVGGANANFVNSTSIAVSSYSSPSTFSRIFVVENYKLISYNLGGANNGTVAGNYGIDGTAIGQFNKPISADYPKFNVSNLYALDQGRFGTITANNFSSTLNFGTNTKSSYPLPNPTDLVVGANFQYLLDRTTIPSPNHLEVHKFNLANGFVGKISIALINPSGMTMDAADNFYFTKQNGSIYNIYKYDNTGAAVTSWATTSSALAGIPSLATDASNNLYVTDGSTNTILKYNGTTGVLMNTFGTSGSANGQLSNVVSIDVDNNGNIYALQDDRFQIFDPSFNFLQRVDFVAGIQPGHMNSPFLIRANYGGTNIAIIDTNSDRVQYFVIKVDQAISFGSLLAKIISDAPFPLTATGGASGNPVTYTSSNAAVATVSGSTVTIVGAGTSIITASQAGNATYNAATDVPQSFTVTKADQVITFNTLPQKNAGDAAFTLSATGGASGNPVTYTSSNAAVATVSGSTVTIVGAGTSIITASQAGSANYNAAADVPQTLTVAGKQNQTITFSALPNKVFNPNSNSYTLSAVGGASGNPVTFSSSDLNVATISGNTITIIAAGTTLITASQAGNGTYNAATDVPQSFTVTKADQVITFNTLPQKNAGDAAFTLSATGGASGNAITFASSNLTVASISGNTLTIVGAGTSIITASQAGSANYNAAADVPQTLTVASKQNQTITFNSLSTITFGTTAFSLTATASSGLAVMYSTLDDEVTIAGTQVTIVKPGFVTINADQSGSAAFNAATQVQRGFCINPVKPTITESLNNTASPRLTSSSAEGNQWFLNGIAITGATNNTFSASQVGSYTVQVKVETCASAVSDAFAIVVTALEDSELISVSCSPNPADDFITIHAPTNKAASAKVFIYNMSGQVMVSGGAENLNEPIRISHYTNGLYIAHVILEGKTFTHKFIKNN